MPDLTSITSNTPNQNNLNKVEDIFQEVDKVNNQVDVTGAIPPSSIPTPQPVITSNIHRIIWSIFVIILIVLLLGGIYIYKQKAPTTSEVSKPGTTSTSTISTTPTPAIPAPVLTPPTDSNPVEPINTTDSNNLVNTTTPVTTPIPIPGAETSSAPNIQVNIEPIIPVVIDSDQDGLTDIEEKALDTNPLSVDTDNDGLFDQAEIKVYRTNPLLSDTDNDGYLDGAEVKSGYNPNGPGKLLILPGGGQQ